ncbi:toll-like receptor 4 [Saccostrea echinata]|uniref:toll-like receptor 4 n=1 Tax=Saccostrea echinata TaxID=191078 RepID=UPI002A82E632|nr:toll-like receptor 4 [Saccostrea echinata]
MVKIATQSVFHILCTLYALFVPCSSYGGSFHREDHGEWKPCNFSETTCICLESDEGLLKADCSHLRLTQVPIFPPNVIWINLQFNFIENISVSYPKNLKHLDLSHNGINSLKDNPFGNIPRLKYLDISSNKLSLSETNFYPGLFKSLESLRCVNLKNNSVQLQGNWSYLGEILSELISLKELRMDAVGNFVLSKGFSNLKNLILLDLSGFRGHCETIKITHDFFLNTPYLEHLDLSSCKIKHIERGAFGVLRNLKSLDISYNKELGFASLPNVTCNLTGTLIKRLNLHNINCLTGLGKRLLIRHVINLRKTKLEEMILSRNRLELFERGLVRYLPPTLQRLSLAENKLLQGPYIADFIGFHNLTMFNMSLQFQPPEYVTAVFELCKENQDDPETFNITMHRDSTNFSTFLHNFGKSYSTKVSHWKPVIYVHCPENLQTIYANNSRLYSKISAIGLIAPKLRHMFFQDNILNEWIGPVYGIQNVSLIDLSNNFCTKLSSDFFVNATGLLHLNISRNSIGDNLESDVNGLIFRNLVSLETLDLSSNKIYHLPYLLLKRSWNIKALILNNNQLSEWNVHVGHMRHLKHLDLSENRIDSIRDEIRKELTNLIKLKNTSIDLSGNNVDCSCENVPYIKWMVEHKENFKRFDDYKCAIKSQKNFNFTDPVTSLKSLVVECRSYTTFYIVGSIVLTVLIFVVIAVMVKRNIWTIRFTIYQCKQKLKTGGRYMQILYQRNRLNYTYDIFISYSARDREFVLNKLFLKLEELNLDVCIRERDFLPGREKADNIMDAIESSKMTLCVVSESYMRSGWRDYELNMAKLEGIKKRGGLHYVYLIILPGAYDFKRKCPNSLKDLINENYFCQHPSEESRAVLETFWNEFSSVVAHKMKTL